MSQLSLDLTAKPKKVVTPIRVPKKPTRVDSAAHLHQLLEQKEPMIYLYGQNPHLCFIRTHSSDDTGTMFPIMRKEAEHTLRDQYRFHCSHISHDGQRARVYLRKR